MSGRTRSNLPALPELIRICGGEGTGADEPRDLRRLYARVIRRLSIRISRLLLWLGLSANEVTIGGIAIGMVGATLLAFNDCYLLLAGLALLQLSFVLDFCDGEIARFQREIENVSCGAGGAFLDWVGHYYLPATITAAVAYGAFRLTGDAWLLVGALIVILSLVRVPYSARDHIMWGVYRDRPEMRDDPAMVRAALARQGGTPELLDLDAAASDRLAGGEGRGLLWKRYTNFGQLIVFPGFINLVAVAVLVDIGLSNGLPHVDETNGRAVLIGLLGTLHLVHQFRAIWQGFRVTRAL